MLRLLRNLFTLALLVFALTAAWRVSHGPSIEDGSWLVLDAGGKLSEAPPPGPLGRLVGHSRTLADTLEALRKVRHDGRIAGVIVRLGSMQGSWAQAEDLRAALAATKAVGKKVVAELEVEMQPASRETLVASVADQVAVAPASAPLLLGLRARAVFLGGAWPKLDVRMQVEQLREYKTAGDELARESMTPAHREMLDSILEDTRSRFVRTVSVARGIAPAAFEQGMQRGITKPAELVEAGLANAVRTHGELLVELGNGSAVATVDEARYADVPASSLGMGRGPGVAVVHVDGMLVQGSSGAAGSTSGSRTLAAALAEAAADDDVAAIVLRVSSPGGSPAASDEGWQAVRDAARRKPVIASLGDVAASGGYYVASAADRIVAEPGTLTGSIGVVFLHPDAGGLLARAGVRTESISRDRYARLLDLDKGLDDDELALVRRQLDDTYRLFLERVAAGRRRTTAEIDRVGGGRVWTGQQAFDRGLVDELGSLDEAVRAAANAAGIHDADRVALVHWPRARSLAAELAEVAASASGPATEARLAEALGLPAGLASAAAWQSGVQALAWPLPSVD